MFRHTETEEMEVRKKKKKRKMSKKEMKLISYGSKVFIRLVFALPLHNYFNKFGQSFRSDDVCVCVYNAWFRLWSIA